MSYQEWLKLTLTGLGLTSLGLPGCSECHVVVNDELFVAIP